MPPRRQQGVPPRRGPPRQGRREIYDPIDVGMRDVESVHQDRTEMEINSPPRSRQRVQSEAENVPPPPPFDMDDLRFLRQEIKELRAENRALRREVDQVRQQVPFPVPPAPAPAPPQPPAQVPRRVARRMLDEEGLSLQEFLRFKTPEYHGEEGDDPQYFLEET